MRLKRRLMVVVRLVTDNAQCKRDAFKNAYKCGSICGCSKYASPRIYDNWHRAYPCNPVAKL